MNTNEISRHSEDPNQNDMMNSSKNRDPERDYYSTDDFEYQKEENVSDYSGYIAFDEPDEPANEIESESSCDNGNSNSVPTQVSSNIGPDTDFEEIEDSSLISPLEEDEEDEDDYDYNYEDDEDYDEDDEELDSEDDEYDYEEDSEENEDDNDYDYEADEELDSEEDDYDYEEDDEEYEYEQDEDWDSEIDWDDDDLPDESDIDYHIEDDSSENPTEYYDYAQGLLTPSTQVIQEDKLDDLTSVSSSISKEPDSSNEPDFTTNSSNSSSPQNDPFGNKVQNVSPVQLSLFGGHSSCYESTKPNPYAPSSKWPRSDSRENSNWSRSISWNRESSWRKNQYPAYEVESQYARTFHSEYNYESTGNQLFTEEIPEGYDVPRYNSKGNRGSSKYKSNYDDLVFQRSPLTDFHRFLCIADFYDIDDYLQLAERPVKTLQENIRNPNNPPQYSGYDSVKEPTIFIGKLTKVSYITKGSSHAMVCCFITLDLNKYKLTAYLKESGCYCPSYSNDNLTDAEIGKYFRCKAVKAKMSGKITWAEAKELDNPPTLKDVFQNPYTWFRPKDWCILNNKIIFDPTLIDSKPNVEFEEFPVKVQGNRVKNYTCSLGGILG